MKFSINLTVIVLFFFLGVLTVPLACTKNYSIAPLPVQPTATPTGTPAPAPTSTPLCISTNKPFLWAGGSPGSGDGQFNGPIGAVMRPGGVEVYVSDSGNNRIEEFDTFNGAYTFQLGTTGSGNGQFNDPTGMTVDDNEVYYVVDSGNKRIQVFDNSFNYVSQWGDGTVFSDPRFIASQPGATNIFVTDSGLNEVFEFTNSGVLLRHWGGIGAGNGQFDVPTGIAVDETGNCYVADSNNNRIEKFAPGGVYTSQWGGAGTGNGQFNSPQGVVFNFFCPGVLYVMDSGNNRIQAFDTNGNYLTQWGGTGNGNGQFSGAIGIAAEANGLVAVDTGNNRMEEFYP